MKSEKNILLGIDFGTGGCKITAVSASDGVVVGEASVEYPTEYVKSGWSEQNPADWYDAMKKALVALKSKNIKLEDVAAIAFDGSTHNAVLLDENYKPVRKTIMWTDQRSVKECAVLREQSGEEIFKTTYQMPSPTWTLPQMMWLKNNEPEILDATKHVLFVKDYVRYLVTGVAATDYIEAQGTLFFDMSAMDWSRELVELSGLNMSAMPKIAKPTDIAGVVSANASAETGLPAGTVVVCGTSDSAVEDYGAGAIEPNDCIIKLATAGNVNVMTKTPYPFKTTLTYSHVIESMWYTVSATNAAALCERWFRDTFCEGETAEAKKSGLRFFDIMDSEAEKSPLGANGILFHPYLQGERSPYWDPDLRASFTGVSISSTRGDFIRALLEGVAFSLKDCYGTIEEMGLPVKKIFLIGGGAKSKLWSQIIADVFNVEVAVPIPGDASYGSALLAGVGLGIFTDPTEAVRKCLKISRTVKPIAKNAEKYGEIFLKYKKIHDALASIYKKNQ